MSTTDRQEALSKIAMLLDYEVTLLNGYVMDHCGGLDHESTISPEQVECINEYLASNGSDRRCFEHKTGETVGSLARTKTIISRLESSRDCSKYLRETYVCCCPWNEEGRLQVRDQEAYPLAVALDGIRREIERHMEFLKTSA